MGSGVIVDGRGYVLTNHHVVDKVQGITVQLFDGTTLAARLLQFDPVMDLAILKLDPGWGESMSINTVEPSPVDETSDNGRFSFDLGPIAAGHSFIFFMQFQVNPTNVAWHRPQNVELDDGNQVIARLHRTITVFP